MLIGYARVSTEDQSLTLQIDALEETGCERVFQGRVGGNVDTRPNLIKPLISLDLETPRWYGD